VKSGVIDPTKVTRTAPLFYCPCCCRLQRQPARAASAIASTAADTQSTDHACGRDSSNRMRADATVRFTGLTQYPGGLLGSITDDGCESLSYPGGSFDNQADLNFDRNRLTEPGQSISVSDASGWTFTVQWVE
jgi:hypothetical protein